MVYYIYQDESDEWRWHLKAANGRILADSGEGYSKKADCEAGIESVKKSSGAPVKDG